METVEQLKEIIKFQQELIKSQQLFIDNNLQPLTIMQPGLIPGIPNYTPSYPSYIITCNEPNSLNLDGPGGNPEHLNAKLKKGIK